jgi:BMFP domain-containing protein YqiC
MSDPNKHLEDLIMQLAASFSREMGELRTEVRTGFDRMEGILQRHSKMIVSGTAAISAVTKSITRLEARELVHEKELLALKDRLRKLEAKKKSA